MSKESILELFKIDFEQHANTISQGLLALEENPRALAKITDMMRAAHSIKGAARAINLDLAVKLAHAMEDCFSAAQKQLIQLKPEHIDLLLQALDQLTELATSQTANQTHYQQLLDDLILLATTPCFDDIDSEDDEDDLDPDLWNIFYNDFVEQIDLLNNGLLLLDEAPQNHQPLPEIMRSAHSIKGACRAISATGHIDLNQVASFTHLIEDCLVAIQNGTINTTSAIIDILLQSIDVLSQSVKNKQPLVEEIKRLSNQINDLLIPTPSTPDNNTDDVDPVLWDIFYNDFTEKLSILSDNLLLLDENPQNHQPLEELMRAAHTIKGSSRAISATGHIDLDKVASLAHKMEDYFVAVQNHKITLTKSSIDTLLYSVDILSQSIENKQPLTHEIIQTSQKIGDLLNPSTTVKQDTSPSPPSTSNEAPPTPTDRSIRVNADTLDQLMGLAGQSLVESRWLQPFINSLIHLKRRQTELISELDSLREMANLNEAHQQQFNATKQKAIYCKQTLSERLSDLEMFNRRNNNLTHRLYQEAIGSRMRPFVDGTQGLQRMIRDISRSLGKQVKLKFSGLNTPVDRDILHKIQAPLNHMLRNALDHGIEKPEERLQQGKLATGQLHLQAIHKAGSLVIRLTDDGRGVDIEALRHRVIEKGFANEDMAANFNDSELLDFLFLPRFTTKSEVSELSGRGVGLDVVHDFIREVRGRVYASTQIGKGMQIELHLPLTLSVMRTLLVEIASETYAFPLARSERVLKLQRQQIEILDDRQYFTWQQQHIGLISASQLLELGETETNNETLCVLLIGDRTHYYGLVIDQFLGEKEVVVQPLDPRLGDIRDIQAAALLEDGSPILIIDVDDLISSIAQLDNQPCRIPAANTDQQAPNKHILVVDDSITVREVERKLLENQGYLVDVAIDGNDGWDLVRKQPYDLVITDIDMPRMNGIELVQHIKQHHELKKLPIIIISYKDSPQDRQLGLHAGADYYLTKHSFQDDSMIEAVIDLIGVA